VQRFEKCARTESYRRGENRAEREESRKENTYYLEINDTRTAARRTEWRAHRKVESFSRQQCGGLHTM
jgi:hypothetical protein